MTYAREKRLTATYRQQHAGTLGAVGDGPLGGSIPPAGNLINQAPARTALSVDGVLPLRKGTVKATAGAGAKMCCPHTFDLWLANILLWAAVYC